MNGEEVIQEYHNDSLHGQMLRSLEPTPFLTLKVYTFVDIFIHLIEKSDSGMRNTITMVLFL